MKKFAAFVLFPLSFAPLASFTLFAATGAQGLETALIQTQIDAASAAGGGVVTVGPGRHVVGTLFLKSNIELHLADDCTLEGSADIADYPELFLEYSEMPKAWHTLVAAVGVTNVAVTGRGTVFGSGGRFLQTIATYGRPRGFIFLKSKDVRLSDLTLRDTGSWGCYLKECDGVRIERMKIDNHANSNNDGIDIESRNVLIADCDVDSGDDAICLKSDNPNFVVENVEVRNCTVRSTCSALKFGTASHGVCRNVRFHDCVVDACRRDTIDPKTGRELYEKGHPKLFPGALCGNYALAAIVVDNVDGGTVEDIVFERIDVKAVLVPWFIRAGSRFHRTFAGVDCGIPYGERRVFRNIVIRDVKAVAMCPTASAITGVELCRPADVLVENCDVTCLAGGERSGAAKTKEVPERVEAYPDPYMFNGILPAYGCYVRHADRVTFRNVTFRLRDGTDARDAIVTEDVTEFRTDVTEVASGRLDTLPSSVP